MLPPQRLPLRVTSVLDVGCGIRPQTFIVADRHVGIDAHRPYLEQAQLEHPDRTFIHATWGRVLPRLMTNSFNVVVAVDFIEHLTKPQGKRFLGEAQRVGRHVGIFTPLGMMEQSYEDGERDAWGMHGGYWQTHRSAWTPEDFKGWAIEVWEQFHSDNAAFWAVKETDAV